VVVVEQTETPDQLARRNEERKQKRLPKVCPLPTRKKIFDSLPVSSRGVDTERTCCPRSYPLVRRRLARLKCPGG
jgi:hypothetical protein